MQPSKLASCKGTNPLIRLKSSGSRRSYTSRVIRPTAAKSDENGNGKSDGNWLDFLTPKSSDGTQIIPNVALPSIFKTTSGKKSQPDTSTVLVAGATGRLGARIVRELLARGLRVRAGVRNPEKAERLEELAPSFGALTRDEQNRLTVVYLDLEDPETIGPAFGRTPPSTVVCAVGAAESEFTDLSAPRRIDYEGSAELVRQAADAGVQNFILVTSLGTGKLGFPAGVLNLFGGVLTFKRKTEVELEKSGMAYTIVRPGGMERPKDDYKLKNNMKIAKRDTLFGGQVSRLQIAELIGAAVQNPDLATNKCLEVVAEPTAPFISYEDLLSRADTEISQEERLARLAAEREVEGELEVAREQLDDAKERLGDIRSSIDALSREAAEAKKNAKAVEKEESAVIRQARQAESELESLKAAAERAALVAAADKAVVAASQTAQREVRLLSSAEIRAIRENVLNPPEEEEEEDVVVERKGRGAGAPALFNMFKTTKQVVEEEEEVVEEVVVAPPAKKKAAPAFAIPALFGGKQPVEEEEVVEEEEEVVVAAAAAPSKSAAKQKPDFGKLFSFASPSKPAPVVEEKVIVEEEVAVVEEPVVVETKKKGGFGGFGSLLSDLAKKAEQVLPIATPSSTTTPAASPPAAKQDPQQQAKAAAAAKADAQARQREEQLNAQRQAEVAAKQKAEAAKAAAEAQAAAEKAKKEAEAKAAAEAEYKQAIEAAKATAAAWNARKQQADARVGFGGIKMPWQQQQQQQEKKEVVKEVVKAEEVPANVASAKKWIDNYKQGNVTYTPPPASSSSTSSPPAAAAAPPSTAADVDNVAEARNWIDSWKKKSQATSNEATTSSSSNASAGADDVLENVTDAREWIARWKAKKN